MEQEQTTGLECIKNILRRYYDLYFKAVYEEHDEEKGKAIWEDIKCFNTIEKELLRLEPIRKYYEELDALDKAQTDVIEDADGKHIHKIKAIRGINRICMGNDVYVLPIHPNEKKIMKNYISSKIKE